MWKGISIHALRRIFNENGGQAVTEAQLREVAKKFGLDPAGAYIESFAGTMNTNDFINSLMDPISARGLALLEKIWGLADAN